MIFRSSFPAAGIAALFGASGVLLGGCGPAAAQGTPQRLLISPLEVGDSVDKGAWKLNSLAVEAAKVEPKVGASALTFKGVAESPGSKGDFTLPGTVPGAARNLSLWVHLAPESNTASLGFQLYDNEGEALMYRVPADWTGWKLVELDLEKATIEQAYKQGDKNGKLDLPIRGVHFFWFTKAAGPSSVTVDGLTVTTLLEGTPELPVQAQISGADWGEPGKPLEAQVMVSNYLTQEAAPKLEYSVQRIPALMSAPAPDPIHGSDHAVGAKSWTEVDGKQVESGSLTDGKDFTNVRPSFGKDKGTEAFQYVDLGRERRITRMTYLSGDANWAWKVDISASPDGQNYTPVPGLQGFDMQKKWSRQTLPVGTPFNARFLRLRYHKDGERVNDFAMPSSLSVYDGPADENWNIPAVGETVASGQLDVKVPARDFAMVPLKVDKPLSTGAYLLAVRAQNGGKTQLQYSHFLVLPTAMKPAGSNSRFGINSAATQWNPSHERLGIGWVRFENLKWPMMSPAPNVYKYDGSVAPWNVNADRIFSDYKAQNLNILPFLFLSPDYATSAGADIPKNRWGSYPPKDNAQMADFVFQTVARYGSAKHAEAQLKTPDKKSGLNQINVYEIWNEPNLTAESWGPWVGTSAQYMEMFRPAAEAVKKADPKAQVTNGGYAGIQVETVDPLRTHTYADGKKPLDFVDILNVHYYSGQIPPEIATNDTNVNRSGNAEGARTYEDDLRRLDAWRDQHKPGMPIWLTETGYDTAGPRGIPEHLQAARLPRVTMLALANGIEKVFLYRESGSTASLHAGSGLFRNDGTVKPSWFTYATLIRELDNVQPGYKLPYPDPNVRLYTWTRGNETILTAWTVEGNSTLKINLGQAAVTDSFGNTRNIAVNNDLQLSDFPVYIKSIGNLAPINALVDQSKKAEAARQQELARLAKARTVLFDFGGIERVGTVDVGTTRAFTAVTSKDTFDAAKGYGFEPGAAMRDDSMHWIKDPLDADSTRMNKDHRFRFQAPPGKYKLTVSASAITAKQVMIKGADGGDKSFPVTRETSMHEAEIQVGNGPLTVETDGILDLRWLSLVEQN